MNPSSDCGDVAIACSGIPRDLPPFINQRLNAIAQNATARVIEGVDCPQEIKGVEVSDGLLQNVLGRSAVRFSLCERRDQKEHMKAYQQ